MEEKNQGGKFKPVETVQIDSVLFSAVVPVYNVEAYLEKCVDCGACRNVCDMQIDPVRQVNHPECIHCGQCKKVCGVHAIH